MNEEKKLSQMLDEIFGDYINNKVDIESKLSPPQLAELDCFIPKEEPNYIKKQESNFTEETSTRQIENNLKLDFFVPDRTKILSETNIEKPVVSMPDNLINLIENLFNSEDIINETDLSFNRFSAVKPVPPIAPPLSLGILTEKPEMKKNVEPQSENACVEPVNNVFNEKVLNPVQQAYTAKAVCGQLNEIFYIYNILIKSSKRININIFTSLRNGISEIMPLAEDVYENIARQNIRYFQSKIGLNNENSAISLIKDRINAILNDLESLINSAEDNVLKSHLIHIKASLSFQLETVNKYMI